jgi:hypothetical protein
LTHSTVRNFYIDVIPYSMILGIYEHSYKPISSPIRF